MDISIIVMHAMPAIQMEVRIKTTIAKRSLALMALHPTKGPQDPKGAKN